MPSSNESIQEGLGRGLLGRSSWWTALPFCLIPILLGAVEPVPPSLLTLEECVAQALKNNPDLQLALRKVEGVEAEYQEHRTKLLPRFLAQADYVRGGGPASEVLNFNQARLVVVQPLFTGGRLGSAAGQARARLASAKQDFGELRNDLIFEVKKAYCEVLQSRKAVEILRQGIQQLDVIQSLVVRRAQARSVIRLDLLKTEAQLLNQKQDLVEAEAALTLAENKFKAMLGWQALKPLQLEDIVPAPSVDLASLENYISQAEAKRLVYSKTRQDLAAAEMGLALARAQSRPELAVQGSYGYSGRQVSSMEKDWTGQVSAVLPLWSAGESRYKADQARSIVEQAKISVAGAKIHLREEVTEAYLGVRSAQARWISANKTLEAGEEGERVAEALYREGNISTVDLLKSQTDWTRAKLDHTKAQYDLFRSLAQLDWSIGVVL